MNALDLLDLCERTYHSPAITAGPNGRDGASIWNQDGETVLVFRGTVCTDVASPVTAFLDWLNDCHREPVARPEFPGRVHEGFYDSLMALWSTLSKQVLGVTKLTITGHSKGGALAVLAGWLLRTQRPQVVTFAAPKVGDSYWFTAAYAASGPPTIRYVNPHDVVPKFPLEGYDSVGSAVLPPPRWKSPIGPMANHHLTTYREWITMLNSPTPPATRAA